MTDAAEHRAPEATPPGGARPGRGRLRDRLLVLAFLVTLTIPVVALVVGSRPGNYLNRTLAGFPTLTLDGLASASYFDELDNFIEDNFPGRAKAISLRATASYRLGFTSNPQVIIGRDGWLFFIESVKATCRVSAEDVLGQVDELDQAFEALGREFRFTLAPDKRTIYPERLPESEEGVEQCTDVARRELRTGMAQRPGSTVDLWTPITEAKSASGDTLLYWAEDTHWNSNGMLPAIRSLVDSLMPGVWAPDAIVSPTPADAHLGGLMRMLGREDLETLALATVDRDYQSLESVPGTMRFGAVDGGRAIPGRTLVIGDSFFERAMPFLAPWFEDLTFAHIKTITDPTVVHQLAEQGVDTVILERVERAAYRTDYVALLGPLIVALGGEDLVDPAQPSFTSSP